MTAETTPRIEYRASEPGEELDIDPVTGKPVVVKSWEPSEIETGIGYGLIAVVVFGVTLLATLFLVFYDIFFGSTATPWS